MKQSKTVIHLKDRTDNETIYNRYSNHKRYTASPTIKFSWFNNLP